MDRKGYDDNGNETFEIKNGNGKDIEYLRNNTRFEGEYINGERNEFGREYDKDGKLKFEGEFKDDKKVYKEIKKKIVKMKLKINLKFLKKIKI